MPKSRIVKDVANGAVDLITSLNRLYLLASDINAVSLMEWVENELQGYSSTDAIPDYRRTKSRVFRYSGLANCYQVTNATLQAGLIPDDMLETISEIKISESVASISAVVETGNEIKRDLGALIGAVFERSGEEIQCTSIYQIIPLSFYRDILSSIRQRITRELIGLEKLYGNLDSLEIQNIDDPENIAFWNNINNRIKNQARDLFIQCFYGPAAERAVREIETKLREMFRELKPNSNEPQKIGDIIGALLTENGVYHYCDTVSQDGKNFCKGFVQLVQGFLIAYRNPFSHTNHTLTKRKAFELISTSSMIMEVLEKGDEETATQ